MYVIRSDLLNIGTYKYQFACELTSSNASNTSFLSTQSHRDP
uniref:Uncharacterized protein n=1 Tax=Lepeophtheirus salmonis TaxID=72036 RepID=A0A0K2T576_LEPSM